MKNKQTKEYIICGNYGQGWEEVNTEMTMEDARRSLKEYRENEPQYIHKLKIKWIK